MNLDTLSSSVSSLDPAALGPFSVVIISNYLPDRQYSMLNHAVLVKSILEDLGVPVKVVSPRDLFGKLRRYFPSFAKWFGYIDKYLLFSVELLLCRLSASDRVVYHIIDHSNSVYSFLLSSAPCVLTCNDLLAVRSARGEFPENRVGLMGRLLQSMILFGLQNCNRILCISKKTAHDLSCFLGASKACVEVAYLPLAYPYKPLSRSDSLAILEKRWAGFADLFRTPFILHVGSDDWYKNRLGVSKIYAYLAERYLGGFPFRVPLLLVGKPPSRDHRVFLNSNRHLDIHVLVNPSSAELNALYSLARLLVFPSHEEGFGWPIIEAMACGCPVVTTEKPPMTEVGGDAAVYIDPLNIKQSATRILHVLNWTKDELSCSIAKSLRNARRFDRNEYASQLVSAYRSEILSVKSDVIR